jgi:hypothetical protein
MLVAAAIAIGAGQINRDAGIGETMREGETNAAGGVGRLWQKARSLTRVFSLHSSVAAIPIIAEPPRKCRAPACAKPALQGRD